MDSSTKPFYQVHVLKKQDGRQMETFARQYWKAGGTHLFKPVSEVLQLRREVAEQTVPFVIDLYHYATGTPHRPETDAHSFFEVTYPSVEVRSVVAWLSSRYSGGAVPGSGLILGRYGAGKSHVLLTAAHLLSDPAVASDWLNAWGMSEFKLPEDVKVWARHCTSQEAPLLWEAFFTALGCPNYNEKVNIYPDRDLIERALGNRRVLMILDEAEGWFRALPADLQIRNANFLQTVSEVAADSLRMTLLVSLLGEASEPANLLRRMNPFVVPASDQSERIRIIRHRLFRAPPPEAVVGEAARAGAAALCKVLRQPPAQVEEQFATTYPLHPSLAALLLDRFPKATGFQRTRGILHLVATLYRKVGTTAPILSADLVDPSDPELAAVLQPLDGTGGDLIAAALADARRIPKAAGALFTLLLYSLAPDSEAGVSEEELLAAQLGPAVQPWRARERLALIRSNSWYTHIADGGWRLSSRPSARGLAAQRGQQMPAHAAVETVAAQVEALFRLWPRRVVARDVYEAREFILERRFDDGRDSVLVLLLRSASDSERRSLTHGLTYRNLVVVVEPLRDDLDVLATPGVAREAALLWGAQSLLPEVGSVLAQEVGKVAEDAARSLQSRLRSLYGRFVRWLPGGERYEMEPIDNLEGSRLLLGFYHKFYTAAYFQEAILQIAPHFAGRELRYLLEQFAKQPGLPVPIPRDTVMAACRHLAEAGRLRFEPAAVSPESRLEIAGADLDAGVARSPEASREQAHKADYASRPEMVGALERLMHGVAAVSELQVTVAFDHTGELGGQFRALAGEIGVEGSVTGQIRVATRGRLTADEARRWLATVPAFPGARYSVTLRILRFGQ